MFTIAVEGPSDEMVLRKIVATLGHDIGQVHGRNGKQQLLKNLLSYNYAARFTPWIVLLDLDREQCVLEIKTERLPQPSPMMCLRFAVREVEAWLLSDRQRFGAYFSVSEALVPHIPDDLEDPKLALINLIRKSKRSAIRLDMIPDQGLGQSIGPAYTSRIIEFAGSNEGWRPEIAAETSPSLRRAMNAIRALALTTVP